MLECASHIISYLADVMNALRQNSGQGSSQLMMEGEEKAIEVDSDWVEELAVEEDDSQAEDSVSRFSAFLEINIFNCTAKTSFLFISKYVTFWFFNVIACEYFCVLG